MSINTEKCNAVLTDENGKVYHCELPLGHTNRAFSKTHRFEGVSWTQAGADRLSGKVGLGKV
jgi:hypothetical protein